MEDRDLEDQLYLQQATVEGRTIKDITRIILIKDNYYLQLESQ